MSLASVARSEAAAGGSPSPGERLAALCDPGSLRLLHTAVRSDRLGDRAVDGDGVLTATGRVDGRPIVAYVQDASFMGGSLGAAHAAAIVDVLRLAERGRRPVVAFVSSGGARLQEGLAALGGYGEIFAAMVRLSAVVPQISVVTGTSAGGGAYSPALGDVVVMTRESSMFLTGPRVVRDVMGEDVSIEELGGPRVQGTNGVAHILARDDVDAVAIVRDLLAHFPSCAGDPLPRVAAGSPEPGDPGDPVPAEPRQVYDVRAVLARLLDGGALLPYGERWARNVVCGWGRLHGAPVGIVANQPKYLGGVLDAAAAEKAAGFVGLCDRFGIPLAVLVDTPGFLPGLAQERAAVIRHGAGLVRAFSATRVPKLTVVLRKSFGGAHIAMNSKQLGADLVLAWPGATLGVMGAEQAVGIVHRRRLEAVEDAEGERSELAAAYAAEHLTARRAAEQGFVDEVICPAETRGRLAAGMELLARQ